MLIYRHLFPSPRVWQRHNFPPSAHLSIPLLHDLTDFPNPRNAFLSFTTDFCSAFFSADSALLCISLDAKSLLLTKSIRVTPKFQSLPFFVCFPSKLPCSPSGGSPPSVNEPLFCPLFFFHFFSRDTPRLNLNFLPPPPLETTLSSFSERSGVEPLIFFDRFFQPLLFFFFFLLLAFSHYFIPLPQSINMQPGEIVYF